MGRSFPKAPISRMTRAVTANERSRDSKRTAGLPEDWEPPSDGGVQGTAGTAFRERLFPEPLEDELFRVPFE
jgi:hypothetical protein